MFRSDSPIYIFTQTHLILLTYGSRVAWWEALLFHSSRISGSMTNSGYCLCGDLHVLLVFGWVASHLSKNAGRWTGCVKLTLVVNVCVHSAVWWSGTHSGCIPALLLVFSGLALDLLSTCLYGTIPCVPYKNIVMVMMSSKLWSACYHCTGVVISAVLAPCPIIYIFY